MDAAILQISAVLPLLCLAAEIRHFVAEAQSGQSATFQQ
jgi:hypothetical protein